MDKMFDYLTVFIGVYNSPLKMLSHLSLFINILDILSLKFSFTNFR